MTGELRRKPGLDTLPQSIEAEQVVIGSALLEPMDAGIIAVDMLEPDDFYERRHRVIFRVIRELLNGGQVADIVLVANRIEELGKMPDAGGRLYLNELLDRTTTTASLEHYGEVVRRKSILRRMIDAGHMITELGRNEVDDVSELLDKAMALLLEPQTLYGTAEIDPISAIGEEYLTLLKEIVNRETGLTTGYNAIDGDVYDLRGQLTVIAGVPHMGKCFQGETNILLYGGKTKKVQDVRPGDKLMGPDSKPRNVLSVSRGKGEMFRISPVKGMPYVVNEDHILSLKYSRKVGGKLHQIRNMSVKEYLALGPAAREKLKGWRTGVDWPEKEVSLDPYILGAWLGDGDARGTILHLSDKKRVIINAVESFAERSGLVCWCKQQRNTKGIVVNIRGKDSAHGSNSVRTFLKRNNLMANKHVPHDYLVNSRENRLQLLAGLLDTDGNLSCNCFRIVQKRKQLALDIEFLARSLGFAAYCKPIERTCTNNGKTGMYWRVTITGNLDEIPTRMANKKAAPRTANRDPLVTGISVEPVGEDDYYGFVIDGDHLFLLGDFTVTHNTVSALNIIKNQAMRGYRCGVISLEMRRTAVVERLIQMVGHVTRDELRYDKKKRLEAATKTLGLPIWVSEVRPKTLPSVLRQMRVLVRKHKVDTVLVDYLQLVDAPKADREDIEIGMVTRAFLDFAQENNVAVISPCQVNRESMATKGEPKLWQMKGCLPGDALVECADTGRRIRMDEIVAGNNVWAIDENLILQKREILDVWKTGKKEMLEITTESGAKITCSTRHKFRTENGWERAEDIGEGTLVAEAFGSTEPLMSSSDRVLWKKVVFIRAVGEQETFDLEVEGLHNYCVDGFITHNSAQIEAHASIILGVWRPSYTSDSIVPDSEQFNVRILKNRSGISGARTSLMFFPREQRIEQVAFSI